jgi:hypothetical protein
MNSSVWFFSVLMLNVVLSVASNYYGCWGVEVHYCILVISLFKFDNYISFHLLS